MIEVKLPIKTVSLLNQREHFRVTAKRKAEQRSVVGLYFRPIPIPAMPVTVTMTRLSSGTLDAHDNLPSAFKHIVDALALWLGVDDADARVVWKYEQQKVKRGVFGVIVKVTL